MPSVVGIFVEQGKTGPVPNDDVIGFVVIGLSNARKQTLIQRGFRREDVFDTPRSMEWFHQNRVAMEQGKVKATAGQELFFRRDQPAAQHVDQRFHG